MELGLKSVDAADGGAGEVEHVAIGTHRTLAGLPPRRLPHSSRRRRLVLVAVAPCS